MRYQSLEKVNSILDIKQLNSTISSSVFFTQLNKKVKEQIGSLSKVTLGHYTKYFMWILKQRECHFLYLHS